MLKTPPHLSHLSQRRGNLHPGGLPGWDDAGQEAYGQGDCQAQGCGHLGYDQRWEILHHFRGEKFHRREAQGQAQEAPHREKDEGLPIAPGPTVLVWSVASKVMMVIEFFAFDQRKNLRERKDHTLPNSFSRFTTV